MATPAPPASSLTPEPPGAVPGSADRLESIQRDKLALIGQLASSVAHELSNPLASIVASAQAILAFWPRGREGWAPPPEGIPAGVPLRQLREDLELILAEARRAGEVVHGLLASARSHPPEWCICSLADVVRRTVGLCRHHLKLHNITLQSPAFDPSEGYPLWSRVRGDANQLQQVLLNLIVNAEQAITAARGYGVVRLTLAPDGADRVVLTVEDDGPGVPEALQQEIFRPGPAAGPASSGLGLAISAGIVHSHGGTIALAPRAGGGTLFRLVLPSLAASDRGADPGIGPDTPVVDLPVIEPAEPAAGTRLYRVLLVDDEAGIRRSVSRFLRRYGFQVTDVPSAQAALQALTGGGFDVIVSDLRMPGLSGEEFFTRLGCEFPEMARRVVFTSGDMEQEETRAFLSASRCPALQKPFELVELVRTLRAICPAAEAAPDRRATA